MFPKSEETSVWYSDSEDSGEEESELTETPAPHAVLGGEEEVKEKEVEVPTKSDDSQLPTKNNNLR